MTEQELKGFGDDFIKYRPDLDHEPIGNYFKPFQHGGVTDPVATWALRHLIVKNEIQEIMFLLDWLPKRQIDEKKKSYDRSVDQEVKYCKEHWENTEKFDSTLSMLMWAPWSRDLLAAHHCLPVNSLWGIRTTKVDEAVNTWEHLLTAARETIIKPIIARTGAKKIYACHANLRWLQDDLPKNVMYLYHPAKFFEWMIKKPVSEKVLKSWEKREWKS